MNVTKLKRNMNKNQRTQLKALSEKLDAIYVKEKGAKLMYGARSSADVSNEDMELANHNPEEGEDYRMKIPVYYEVNHFRRLKRSFVKQGAEGVYDYLYKLGMQVDKSIVYSSLNN